MQNINWVPIGSYKISDSAYLSFNGCYDGNHYMVKNLSCDTEADYAGLFGTVGNKSDSQTNTCVISNLSVYGNVKTTGKNAGGIAGEICTGGTVQNCSFTGDIAGAESSGGIVGSVYSNCIVQSCYQNGKVSAEVNAGGLVGSVRLSSIKQAKSASLINNYHTGGNVSAASENGIIGGIAGFTEESTAAGISTLKMDNNYYLTDSCKYAVNNKTAEGCKALPDTSLKKAYEVLDAPFVADASNVNGGYPVLKWQKAFGYNGDMNSDGSLTKEDAILLQKWLLGYPDLTIRNWIAGDLDENEILDASDLTMMKQRLIAVSDISPEKIELNKYSANLKLEGAGSTVQLFAGITPESESNQNVTWASSNAKVATVSKDGLVQAVGSGKAVITAKTASGGLTATCTVTVEQPRISISQKELSIYVTESETLEATTLPSKQTVTWKSDNVKAVTVKNGVITAVAPGTANITASFTYNGTEVVSEKCAVTVLPPSVTFEQTSLKLYVTDTKQLKVSVHPGKATVRWISSDNNIVTVNNGLLTAIAPGTAEVTAKINVEGEAYSSVCKITVTNAVSVSAGKAVVFTEERYLQTNQTLDDFMSAYSTAENRSKINWKSSNANVVEIWSFKEDEFGSEATIKTKSEGTAVITAEVTIDGRTYSDSFTIKVLKPGYYFNITSAEITVGEAVSLYVHDANGSRCSSFAKWSISNDCVTWTNDRATGQKEGTAVVTAVITDDVKGREYTMTCRITVKSNGS